MQPDPRDAPDADLSTVPVGPPAPGLWRTRDFRLLWGGGLVNDVGDWVMIVALPLYVLVETGSGVKTALLFLSSLVPTAVLGSFGGNLVDRWNLRRTLVATNVAQAVTLLPLLAVTPDRVWPAFLVAAAQAVLTRLNNPASAAMLVRAVDEAQFARANSARAISDNLARLVGSPLGGIVVAAGGLEAVVAVNGASFLVVAVTTSFVRADASPARGGRDRGTAPTIGTRAGLDELRRRRPLPALLTAMGISQIGQGMFVVLFLAFVTRRLGGSESDVGLIRGMQAFGGILGGLVIGRFARDVAPGRLIAAGFGGLAAWGYLTWNLPAVTTRLWVYGALMGVAGLGAVSCAVGIVGAAQRYTPREYLGLLVGTGDAVQAIGQGVGAMVAGVLVDRVRLPFLLNSQSSLYLLTAAIGLTAIRPGRDPADVATT